MQAVAGRCERDWKSQKVLKNFFKKIKKSFEKCLTKKNECDMIIKLSHERHLKNK